MKNMKNMNQKLWCDLKTDCERIEFLESGRACETGIIAPAMVGFVVAQYRRLQAVREAIELETQFSWLSDSDEVRSFAEKIGHVIDSIQEED